MYFNKNSARQLGAGRPRPPSIYAILHGAVAYLAKVSLLKLLFYVAADAHYE